MLLSEVNGEYQKKRMIVYNADGTNVYRHMELEKPLTGAFTIIGLTKKMDALRKASHLL